MPNNVCKSSQFARRRSPPIAEMLLFFVVCVCDRCVVISLASSVLRCTREALAGSVPCVFVCKFLIVLQCVW